MSCALAAPGRLAPEDAIELVQKTAAVLRQEPNLLRLNDPITGITCVFFLVFDILGLCVLLLWHCRVVPYSKLIRFRE